jgi:hypothetical protein
VGLPFSYLRDFSDGFETKSNFGYFPNSFSTLDFSQLEAAGRVCHRRGFLAYKALLAHLDRGMVERWSLSLRFKHKSFVLGIKPLAKLPLFLSS